MIPKYGIIIAVQEPVFWAGVSDQWLSMTLDLSSALLVGLWQNTELAVCKKHLMYIILLSFKKLIQQIPWQNNKILVLLAFIPSID